MGWLDIADDEMEAGSGFMSTSRSIVARHPYRALTKFSSSLWSATADIALPFPSDPGTRGSFCNTERHLPTALAGSKENGECALLWWWNRRLAVDSDDCRSSYVTRASGSPDIGCSSSDSIDASDGNTEGFSDYQR